MIVNNFNLVRIVLLPAETDAPPVIYGAARKLSTSRHHERHILQIVLPRAVYRDCLVLPRVLFSIIKRRYSFAHETHPQKAKHGSLAADLPGGGDSLQSAP